MLSIPTLWTAFVINFLTMGLIWAYVMRSYHKLAAAKYWTAACCRVLSRHCHYVIHRCCMF